MQLAMLINLNRCIACNTCYIVCQRQNNVAPGVTRNRLVAFGPKGRYPLMHMQIVSVPCMHCDNAPCVRICPVQATYQREDGIVVQDDSKCIGCRDCMPACPYDARSYNKNLPFGGEPPRNANPAVPIRSKHTIEKCTFCIELIDSGELMPYCVQFCPGQAMTFGDTEDPESDISKALKEYPIFTLRPEQNTRPRVYYTGVNQLATERAIQTNMKGNNE